MSKITLEDIERARLMGHTREKKPIAYTQEAKQEAKAIVEDFEGFTDGIRVLMLIHRSKDGATHSVRHLRMLFTRNSKEYEESLAALIEDLTTNEIKGLRIYGTVNERDVIKSIRTFRIEQIQLENQLEQMVDFYMRIKSSFASCLMRPANRMTSNFLFDVDNPMTLDEALGILDRCSEKPEVLKQYPTKNGWHIITKPFNYTKLEKDIPCQKDGLLLLKY